MLGIKLNNQDPQFLTPLERKKQYERLFTFKLILCVLLTNSLLFLLMYRGDQKDLSTNKAKLNYENDFFPLELALEIVFPLDETVPKIPIMIYNQEKKQIINKGFLHTSNPKKINDQTKFIVEIHRSELKTIISNQEQLLYAYPYEEHDFASNQEGKKRNSYEISF